MSNQKEEDLLSVLDPDIQIRVKENDILLSANTVAPDTTIEVSHSSFDKNCLVNQSKPAAKRRRCNGMGRRGNWPPAPADSRSDPDSDSDGGSDHTDSFVASDDLPPVEVILLEAIPDEADEENEPDLTMTALEQDKPPPAAKRRRHNKRRCSGNWPLAPADSGSDPGSDSDAASDHSDSSVASDDLPPMEMNAILHEVIPDEVNEPDPTMTTLEQDKPPVSPTFNWSNDFATFHAKPEVYRCDSGPVVMSTDPSELFKLIWDQEIMCEIVEQTNLYARQKNYAKANNGVSSMTEAWQDITVDELFRFFVVLIYMSICVRARIEEYWSTTIIGMPEFRKIMSRNRFTMILGMLHFVNNESLPSDLHSYERKIFKISPILKHCNKKFSELYVPQRELSLDESLLLWKDRYPSFGQTIRSKTARYGIKSYDLCEARTGYLLKFIIDGGKGSTSCNPIHGFHNFTANIVLQLMDGFLDKGHLLVMNSRYNQLLLTRYLKTRSTDVVGTLNRNHVNVPCDIKELNERTMLRRSTVSRHCGDISVVAWKDVRMVTILSTYHSNNVVTVGGTRGGQSKPSVIATYNKFIGGVDLKDQKLSNYLVERTRCSKWYMKVFRRLFNISLLNTYIIYSNIVFKSNLTHRQYRHAVAEMLLSTYKTEAVPRPISRRLPAENIYKYSYDKIRFDRSIPHYPVHCDAHENFVPGKAMHKLKRRRCVCCSKQGKHKTCTIMCNRCNVGLCPGKCFIDFHEIQDLCPK